jgi:16S rRNA C967 or C1407 C5-methylase (RsmB/RsmF family)
LRAETTAVIADFVAGQAGVRDVTAARLESLGQPLDSTTEEGAPGRRIAAGSAGMDGFYYALLEKSS